MPPNNDLGLIYSITHTSSGRKYIGKTTKTLHRRRYNHIRDMLHGSTTAIHSAMRKYGLDAFKWEVLEDEVPIEQLFLREVAWIDECNSYKNGFNETHGGDSQGYSHSKETKQQLSQIAKQRLEDGNLPVFKTGHKHSPETVESIRQAQYGHVMSNTHKRTISETHSGKPKSLEHRKRISDSLKKFYDSDRSTQLREARRQRMIRYNASRR